MGSEYQRRGYEGTLGRRLVLGPTLLDEAPQEPATTTTGTMRNVRDSTHASEQQNLNGQYTYGSLREAGNLNRDCKPEGGAPCGASKGLPRRGASGKGSARKLCGAWQTICTA